MSVFLAMMNCTHTVERGMKHASSARGTVYEINSEFLWELPRHLTYTFVVASGTTVA